jgi:hypothetical protein
MKIHFAFLDLLRVDSRTDRYFCDFLLRMRLKVYVIVLGCDYVNGAELTRDRFS